MRWLNKDIIHSFSLLGYLGLILIGNILIFIFLYKGFERFFFSSSALFILFLLIGIFSGFYNVYRTIMRK